MAQYRWSFEHFEAFADTEGAAAENGRMLLLPSPDRRFVLGCFEPEPRLMILVRAANVKRIAWGPRPVVGRGPLNGLVAVVSYSPTPAWVQYHRRSWA